MALVLSILVLAMFALVLGAAALWRRGGSRKQVALMLVLAGVMAVNIAIWTLPGRGGEAPIAQELK
ncbi:MAG TPA: hypothetical protein VF440_03235 [Novosphingobium sp.]